MTIPHTFGPLPGPVPLSYLDDNFTYVIASIASATGPMMNCCLSNLGTSNPFSIAQLVPTNGNYLFINGVNYQIPPGIMSVSGGVQANYTSCSIEKVPGQVLAAGTTYWIYAYMSAGVMTLDFSTSSHSMDATWGIEVKSTDRTCTFVGICHPNPSVATLGAITGGTLYTAGTYTSVPLTGGSGADATATITVAGGAVTSVTAVLGGTRYQVGDVLSAAASTIGGTGSGFHVPVATVTPTTLGSYNAQTIASYYNPLDYYLLQTVAGSTTSASMVELNTQLRLEWVQFSRWLPVGPWAIVDWGTSVSGNQIAAGIGMALPPSNATPVSPYGITAVVQAPSALANSVQTTVRTLNSGSEGYFFATFMAQTLNNMGAATITVQQGQMWLDHLLV